MSEDLRDKLARIAADVIWRIHGPESTDRESAEMDGSDVADALLPAITAVAAQARAETAECIAEDIEALPVYNGGYAISPGYKQGHRRAQNHAARIARQHAKEVDSHE